MHAVQAEPAEAAEEPANEAPAAAQEPAPRLSQPVLVEDIPAPAMDAGPVREAEPVMAAAAPALETATLERDYEPDQERRDKFFSRLSKWAKK